MSGGMSAISGIAGAAQSLTGSGGSSSGSSQTTQPYIMSGPTIAAATGAANAQMMAAQQAAGAIQANTTSAINSLMQTYGSALQIAAPMMNTGNQALAQLNYALGNKAVNPGAAPTAPGAPRQLVSDPEQLLAMIHNSDSYNPNDAKMATSGLQTIANDPATAANAGGGQRINAILGAAGLTDAWTEDKLDGSGNTVKAFVNPTLDQLKQYQQANPDSYNQFAQAINNANNFQQDQAKYQSDVTAYNQQKAQYDQQKAIYDQYNAKGQATGADLSAIINNQPGFQFQQQQGISGLENAASAKGLLRSGNLLRDLGTFNQNLSQTYYQNYISNLANEANMGQAVTQNLLGQNSTLGQSEAASYANQGAGMANAALQIGQAKAGAYLTPVANQQVIMTPYTTSTSSNSSSRSGGLLGGLI